MTLRRFPAVFWAALAAFTVYLAELNNFLRFEGYPLLRLEVLYAVLGAALVATLFGVVYQLAGYAGRTPGRVLRALLIAALTGYAVALVANRSYAVAGAAAAFAIALFTGEKILRAITMTACVVLLTASLGIGQQTQLQFAEIGARKPGSSTKPPIVHVILDEHIGVEGFPPTDPKTPMMKQRIASFYTTHGFKLFGGAYSEYFKTQRSIPIALNFGAGNEAKDNAYFQALKRAGYRINVIQSRWVNYCSALVDSCTTYRAQSYAAIANASLSAAQKAALINRRLVPEFIPVTVAKAFVRLQQAGYDVPIPVPFRDLSPVAINGLAALRRLQEDVANLQPGQVYFAHILLPHRPFVLRPDCTIAPLDHWLQVSRGYSLAERHDAYDQQVLCSLRAIGGVLQAVDSSPAGRNAIVIVHGDHGSRIGDVEPMAENTGKFGDDALIAGFSTLFAVRAPGMSPGYDGRHYSLVDLLHELAASNWRTTGSHPVLHPSVIILDENFDPRRRQSLPSWW